MKIFKFDWNPEIDWVFAEGLKQAKEFYLNLTSCGGFDGCTITNIPKGQWAGILCYNPDEGEPDESDPDYAVDYPNGHNEDDYSCGYKIEYTFAEYAENNSVPAIIASTEY